MPANRDLNYLYRKALMHHGRGRGKLTSQFLTNEVFPTPFCPSTTTVTSDLDNHHCTY